MNDHDPGEQPTLASREVPAAITDPDAVSRALGVQVHLIRTQFVRERLASGQCTAEHIAAMLEWEQHAHQNIRMNYASAMYWHGRLSPFDRHCISLEMQDGFHLSPEHYDAAKHLHDECHELWRLQRYEDRDAAHAAIETLKRLGERLRAEIQRVRTGPDRSAAGLIGALLRTPKAPEPDPTFPPMTPEAREAMVAAVRSEWEAALAARDGLRQTCEDLQYRQCSWEDRRATVDPTRVLLGSQVDRAVSEIDQFLAGAYELLAHVWQAVADARSAVDSLNEALAAGPTP